MEHKMQNIFVAKMFADGLLGDQFQQLQMLQDGGAPDLIADVVTLFCEDGKQIINELTKLLDKTCVEFNKVDTFVHQLMGSSACIGAQRVWNACIQFRDFCQEKSRDGCLKTLNVVRNDFYDLCNKFQTVLETEDKMLKEWIEHACCTINNGKHVDAGEGHLTYLS